jgi:hypothetical protein
MKIDLKRNLKGANGQDSGMMADLLKVVFFSIDSTPQLPLSAEDKYMAYQMAKRLADCSGEIDITIEEAAFFKKVCAVGLVAGAYGQVVDLLEGN